MYSWEAMDPITSNPWVVAQIERALEPYVGRIPASELEWMRKQLVETLTSDEHAASVLRGALPRDVEQSGEVVRGTVTPAAAEAEPAAKRGGGRGRRRGR